MKRVPKWMQRVLCFVRHFPCPATRDRLLDELMSGNFDENRFVEMCRSYHIAFDENDRMIDYPNYGAFFNQNEAIRAAGRTGSVKSMQGVLHIFVE